jgi:hypothetical protein
MSERVLIGYLLLALFVAALVWAWSRWRSEVRRERMRRWGTPLSPRAYARKSRPRSDARG